MDACRSSSRLRMPIRTGSPDSSCEPGTPGRTETDRAELRRTAGLKTRRYEKAGRGGSSDPPFPRSLRQRKHEHVRRVARLEFRCDSVVRPGDERWSGGHRDVLLAVDSKG